MGDVFDNPTPTSGNPFEKLGGCVLLTLRIGLDNERQALAGIKRCRRDLHQGNSYEP
jgi:hypothetical protein